MGSWRAEPCSWCWGPCCRLISPQCSPHLPVVVPPLAPQCSGDDRPSCSGVLRLLSDDLMWNRGEHMTWDLGELSRVLDDGGLVAAWFLRSVLRIRLL